MEQNILIGYIIMKHKTDCQVVAVKGIQAEGGTFQNFVNATFEKKKIKLSFCEADLCREKYKKLFVESGSSERVLIHGKEKGSCASALGEGNTE